MTDPKSVNPYTSGTPAPKVDPAAPGVANALVALVATYALINPLVAEHLNKVGRRALTVPGALDGLGVAIGKLARHAVSFFSAYDLEEKARHLVVFTTFFDEYENGRVSFDIALNEVLEQMCPDLEERGHDVATLGALLSVSMSDLVCAAVFSLKPAPPRPAPAAWRSTTEEPAPFSATAAPCLVVPPAPFSATAATPEPSSSDAGSVATGSNASSTADSPEQICPDTPAPSSSSDAGSVATGGNASSTAVTPGSTWDSLERRAPFTVTTGSIRVLRAMFEAGRAAIEKMEAS
ncbi:hypothetical protein [Corynebacterium pyruviciproducens]|uniref:Uncharacterized protein n=1 Tax=Corynebacterium pyruviciproducens TaxID=598660 RepID=A0AAF1BT69_9CORY|nr:hypothetical protein [Corynebacterium pyruviciproducens]WOT02884.1 hypothetical protein CYJ47_03695 [Corynebacterium pyruviciproducens]